MQNYKKLQNMKSRKIQNSKQKNAIAMNTVSHENSNNCKSRQSRLCNLSKKYLLAFLGVGQHFLHKFHSLLYDVILIFKIGNRQKRQPFQGNVVITTLGSSIFLNL